MNTCLFIGKIYKDLELKGEGDKKYLHFSIGVSRQVKSKTEQGKYEVEMDYFNCTAFGYVAEKLVKKYVAGDKVFVEGELRNNNYEKNGVKIYGQNLMVNKADVIPAPKKEEEQTVNQVMRDIGSQPF